jgi:hypothetical protein
LIIASAVSNDGARPWISLEIVEWSMPVRMAKVRWLMPRCAMASRSQPPKSPSAIRLGRTRSSTSRCPLCRLGRGQREPWTVMCWMRGRVAPVHARRGTVSPVAQRGGTATVGTSALHSLPRLPPMITGRLRPQASVELLTRPRVLQPVPPSLAVASLTSREELASPRLLSWQRGSLRPDSGGFPTRAVRLR